MRDSDEQDEARSPNKHTGQWWLIGTIIGGVLFIALLAWGIYALWQLDEIPVRNTFRGQMMHRKSETMAVILDGLVRGDLGDVEDSAEQMWEIGDSLNWYMSSRRYGDNQERFRDSTAELIEAARQRDHSAAKESVFQLETSCIECHRLLGANQTEQE